MEINQPRTLGRDSDYNRSSWKLDRVERSHSGEEEAQSGFVQMGPEGDGWVGKLIQRIAILVSVSLIP